MASFDDIFGGSKSGSKFVKFTEDKETFLLAQSGEPIKVDQKDDKGRLVWLVKLKTNDRYKPMAEGTFDPEDENTENVFQPDANIHIPVDVIGHKDAKGETVAEEQYSATWDTSAGDIFSKLKDALLEEDANPEVGTVYAVKRLDSKKKPYTYSVKVIKKAE